MYTRFKAALAVIVAAVVMAAGVYAFFGLHIFQGGALAALSGSGPACCKPDAASKLRLTLDPQLFAGEVRAAYQVAQDDPALLAQLHCYCGCDKLLEHKNLLDCFRDKHGSVCPICVSEAVQARRMAKQGMPIDQIRDALRAQYARGD
ncbi:MAG TPA: CYCXC family (seleno)protein [Candidatus Binataceae bacterium]|nr:CYCXC family (seleno)protein [Candidatus Binataceae bacterium]